MVGFVDFQSDTPAVWEALNTVSGTRAFDVGANGGLVSTALASRFEEVVAIEPAHESYARLVETSPANVRCLNVAASDHAGSLTLRVTTLTARLGELFTDNTLPWGGSLGERTVPAVTLDNLAVLYGYPDFLKVDTEGHEVSVLRGAGHVLCRDPAFVIEVHSAEKGRLVQSFLAMLGLAFGVHYHAGYRDQSPYKLEHYWVTSPAERLHR